ncbi:FAD-binding protein, partial [Gordonibacter sp.]|uniref:FAD-binding protein n=1 Tax=Gordonibacter sp. TaxID=1968902 RepID=UPI002FCC7EFC
TIDVLIVGAGNGGMMAAATAVDEGVDFIICEKNTQPQSTRHWIGAVDTAQQKAAGVEVDRGTLLNELARYASYKCDMDVWKVWIDESAEMLGYLDPLMEASLGIKATVDTEKFDKQAHYTPMVQHMYLTDPALGKRPEKERNQVLYEYIQSKGHDVSFGHKLVKLVREGDKEGRVTGAIFETDGGYVRINATKGVLLTTGGYAGNAVMTKALAPIVPQCTTTADNTPSCDGSGIKAALWAGAKMDPQPAPMLFARGAVAPGIDAGYDGEGESAALPGNIFQSNIGTQPFMKVDRLGKRFVNEASPYEAVCFASSNRPGGVWCEVWDGNVVEDVERFSTVGCSKMIAQAFAGGATPEAYFQKQIDGGTVFKADTVDELAGKLGFEGEAKKNFLAKVERYNELYDQQSDSDFGKEAFRLSALRTPPFYGGWFGACYLTTVDGIKINANMQALDEKSQVIEGLYCAGDCSGSLFADNYPEYIIGCACGRTLTFSRHAVKFMKAQ